MYTYLCVCTYMCACVCARVFVESEEHFVVITHHAHHSAMNRTQSEILFNCRIWSFFSYDLHPILFNWTNYSTNLILELNVVVVEDGWEQQAWSRRTRSGQDEAWEELTGKIYFVSHRDQMRHIGLDWIGLNWIELNWIKLNWIELNWIELNWIELN